MFTDPLITRSSYWVLSTSAINSPHFGPYGWGEVVHDGFGVPYVTGFDGESSHLWTFRSGYPVRIFVNYHKFCHWTSTDRGSVAVTAC